MGHAGAGTKRVTWGGTATLAPQQRGGIGANSTLKSFKRTSKSILQPRSRNGNRSLVSAIMLCGCACVRSASRPKKLTQYRERNKVQRRLFGRELENPGNVPVF